MSSFSFGTLQWYHSMISGSAYEIKLSEEARRKPKRRNLRKMSFTSSHIRSMKNLSKEVRQPKEEEEMKLLEGFKKKKVAVRPTEGFKKERKTHALPTLTKKMNCIGKTRAWLHHLEE